jgi:hypothetical protein
LVIWLIFFLFLQTKPCFCRLVAWSQLEFSAIPVSISAVSLGRLTTYMLLDLKVAKWTIFSLTHLFKSFSSKYVYFKIHDSNIAKYSKCNQREETSEKRDIKFVSFQNCVVINLSAPTHAFVFVPSFQQLNSELYRQNSLIGNERKYPNFQGGLLLAALPSSMVQAIGLDKAIPVILKPL